METFKVEFYPFQKQSKYQLYLALFGSLVYIGIGIINLFEDNLLGWLWIVLGLFYWVLYYYQKNFSSKYFFEINDNYILVQQNAFKKSKINLNSIKEIHIKPISIEFSSTDNKKKEVSLGNTSFKNVIEIKSKLHEIAKEKNIKIN